MRIAVDVMGGDYAPVEIIAGAWQWIQDHEDSQVMLVGREELIRPELGNYSPGSTTRITIINAAETIGMEESPAMALRRKKDASITVATRLVKEGQADAVLSCGSTGAQMAAAVFILGRMDGIERPPIMAAVPGPGVHNTLLLDVGANVDCKPQQLLQFAALGSAYAAGLLGRDNPRIALLNNGEEESKGDTLAVQTYELLRQQTGLNFIGNIEGRDLFSNRADVVVCDGFTGNILLKSVEGMALFIMKDMLKNGEKLPGILDKFNYSSVGGAPLLGVNGVSIVCHGSSKREAVASGLAVAQNCVNKQIITWQQTELGRLMIK